METFEVLTPPLFSPTGVSKTYDDLNSEDFIATFNLWLVKKDPVPSIVYQQRSLKKSWAPGKMDVAVGGKISFGESIIQGGTREAKEELGLEINEADLVYVGRKIHSDFKKDGKLINSLINIYLTELKGDLSSLKLIDGEVEGIFLIPVTDLISLHEGKVASVQINGVDLNEKPTSISITKDSFPANWDNYHYKMARIIKSYFEGVTELFY